MFELSTVSRVISLLEGITGELPEVSKETHADGTVSISIGNRVYTDKNNQSELVSSALHNLMGAVAVAAIQEAKVKKEKHELDALRDRTTRRFYNDDRMYSEIPVPQRRMVDAVIAAEKGK